MPRAAAALLLVLFASLSAGCASPQRLDFQDAFAQSDAAHDGRAWQVNLRGRVVNLAQEEARRVVLVAGIARDCLSEPALPGYVDVGNLAGGASTNVRASFEHEAPAFDAPALWWRLRAGDSRAPEAKGCGSLGAA